MKSKRTNAPVPRPSQRTHLMAKAPLPSFAPSNLSHGTDRMKDLNFKVPPDFHTEFKTTAASHGMSMRELLEASYQLWIDKFEAKK